MSEYLPSQVSPPEVYTWTSLYCEETMEDDRWSAQIKIDYDRVPVWRNLRQLAVWLRARRLRVTRTEGYRNQPTNSDPQACRTRRSYHVRIWLDGRFTTRTILRAQAIAGDDTDRHAMNVARVRARVDPWNLLFTKRFQDSVLVAEEVHDTETTRHLRAIFPESDNEF